METVYSLPQPAETLKPLSPQVFSLHFALHRNLKSSEMWRVKKKYISQALWLRMSLAQSNAAAVNFTSVLIFWRDHIGLTYFFASLWKDLSCYRQLRMFVEFTSHLQSQITAPAIKNDVFFEPRAREINFSRFTPFCEVILDDHTPLSCGQILHLKCHQSELDMQLCFTN